MEGNENPGNISPTVHHRAVIAKNDMFRRWNNMLCSKLFQLPQEKAKNLNFMLYQAIQSKKKWVHKSVCSSLFTAFSFCTI